MENLRNNYRDEEDDDDNSSPNTTVTVNNHPPFAVAGATVYGGAETPEPEPDLVPELPSSDDVSDNQNTDTEINYPKSSPKFTKVSETEEDEEEDEEDEEEEPPPKKQKPLSSLTPPATADPVEITTLPSSTTEIITTTPMTAKGSASKNNKSKSKSKKKNNNVWTKPASRKGKKKNKNNSTQKTNNKNGTAQQQAEDKVLITPIPRFPDKNDDNPDMKICLSKVYKAEKVELSEDRLSAGSTKGYRMVRATRGVMDGAWYFEIKVVKLGVTGHTRLGWSTDKGDLQAPVGYDANSYGYRDIDGSKIYKALREKYGEEGYEEGDVLGFYINLPEGDQYAPSPPRLVWYKGQRYMCALDAKENPPKIVPGSEISFFKNGICQGVAFKDLYGGRYYPAASMYTLPNQSSCVVKFNFGPEFECFPEDFGGRTVPKPMIEVPYHGFDLKVDNGNPWNSTGMCPPSSM